MSLYSLKIKDTEFKVAVISEPARMKEGLAGKPALGKNKGLLFDFGKEQEVTMNMKKMNYPLDMIFINMSREVVAVRTLEPGNFQTTVKNVRFVLEVNKDEGAGFVGELIRCTAELAKAVGMKPCSKEDEEESEESEEEEEEETAQEEIQEQEGISVPGSPNVNIIVRVSTVPDSAKQLFKKGGTFKLYEDQVKADANAMQVLDDTGKVLMNIVGGERIFSIEHTEQLVALSKKVDRGEAEEEELGTLMKAIIHKQNTQKPEYV
jgi:uncharacterized membrane protein (UPF0127 family)